MSTIDQHKAMRSLEKALVPKSNLIDGRSEKDQLCLLIDFAGLFNFYDQNNKLHGNWSPFLLKDPVFLVASIAKTSFEKAYTLFLNTCLQLQRSLAKTTETLVISNMFNQLFEQLTRIFQTLQQWTMYMKNSTYTYNLKTYVLKNVTDTFSLLLWSLLDFQQALFEAKIIPFLQPVNSYAFDNYDQKIWKNSKGEQPYWTVLDLPTVPCKNEPDSQCFYITEISQTDVFIALQYAGKKLFSFYGNCISYADTELQNIQKQPGRFPDTLLLRTFTDLLKIYQTQLNSLATAHLNFYYRDILLQTPKSTVADTVFAACELTRTTDTFRLPANTAFSAGTDADKQPIIFETTTATSLNPAKISNAYTLVKTKTNNNTQLYLEQLPSVTKVIKDESGAIQSWNTFGSQLAPKGLRQTVALAFASPLLYLAEAKTRKVTLNFTFSNDVQITFSQPDFTFYLSTKEAWYAIPQTVVDVTVANQICFTLDAKAPAISAFTKNPDGYESDWPLCKIVFPNYNETYKAASIKTLDIEVVVTDLQNFQLCNDFGALDASKPFQPFGPTPSVHQNFMIGSNEIFSKPVKDISCTLNWNPFPTGFNFEDYYTAYNSYLRGVYAAYPITAEEEKKLITTIVKAITTLFEKILQTQKTFYQTVLKASATAIEDLVKTEIETLKKLITVEIASLEKQLSTDHVILRDLKSLLQFLIADIEAILQNIVDTTNASGTLDSQHVSDAKDSATQKITDAKKAVLDKLETLKEKILATIDAKKESVFSRIGDAVGNLFRKKETILNLPFFFSNDSFFVDFTWLQNGFWDAFTMQQENNEISSTISENLFFPLENTNASIPNARTFDFSGIEVALNEIDPKLQQQTLQLSDTSTIGFLKMQFVFPSYGFGAELYPKVVGAIALYNGNLIANKSTDPLVNPPNLPFTPTVKSISGTYKAAYTYDFSKSKEDYPLDYFYYTPFETYKVYDAENGIIVQNTTLGNSPTRNADEELLELKALPLLPNFSANGQLFLALENVIAPAQISLYFELARTYTEQTFDEKTVLFSYLSTTGWKALTVLQDGTNNFTCSGILTLNVPEDITNVHETMLDNNFWIAIGTNNATDSFAKTTFLNTNGITLQRVISTNMTTQTAPQLQANVITSPAKAIPQISATVQPFPSFGGKASETTPQMNSRVSLRLKTKDRLVTAEDYFNTIRLEFPEVYYSKTAYANISKKVTTYLAKRVSDASEANAFEPLVSECTELEIQQYLQDRLSPFTSISISNFTLVYIKITATITIDTSYEIAAVKKEINNGINIFISPWITSAQAQITIDKGLNTAELASFINSFDAVIDVSEISFIKGTKDFNTGTISYANQTGLHEYTAKDGELIVPSLNNTTKNSTIQYQYQPQA